MAGLCFSLSLGWIRVGSEVHYLGLGWFCLVWGVCVSLGCELGGSFWFGYPQDPSIPLSPELVSCLGMALVSWV